MTSPLGLPEADARTRALARLRSPRACHDVDDTATRLHAIRHEVGRRWRSGERIDPADVEVVVVPADAVAEVVYQRCLAVDHLVAATVWNSTPEAFAVADQQNRACLARPGSVMSSYFDYGSLEPATLAAVTACTDMPYHLSYTPLQLKVLGRREVLVPGPKADDGQACLLFLRRPHHLDAAWHYLRAVHELAVPTAAVRTGHALLTDRQHRVARLMIDGHRDDAVATELGVSIRTVRSEVSDILDLLGCSNRFAAGAAYALLPR